MEKSLKGKILLLITAIIWGTSFVAQRVSMNFIGPFTFSGVRFLVGALSLLVAVFIFDGIERRKRQETGETSQEDKKILVKGGISCGIVLFFAASLQQMGIVSTTAGKAAFITALYIVLVPILGLFLGKKAGRFVWIGVLLAIVGLYLLSIETGLQMGKGDLIVLLGTVFWASHILVIDHFSPKVNGLKMSCIQFFVAGTLALICAFLLEPISWRTILSCWDTILYTGVMVVGVAYTFQILGQKSVNPSVAAIIMSLESVFGALSGFALLGETMLPREIVGCIFMFAAVLIAQMKPKDMLRAPSK